MLNCDNDNSYYFFIFLDNGKVIKAINADAADSSKRVNPVVIEEMQVFAPNVPIRNLKVMQSYGSEDGRLVVVADNQVQALKLHRCNSNKISSCRCV